MMGPGMEAWLLIMALALSLILPVMLGLLWQGRNRARLEPKTKRKRRTEDLTGGESAPDRDDLIHLEEEDRRWLEDDGAPPVELHDLLAGDDKPKRQEDG